MDSFTLDKIEFDAVRRILSTFCGSSLGKRLAIRLRPSRNPEAVQHWLQQVEDMTRAIREVGLPPLGGLTDVTAAVGRAKPGGTASGEDFAAIASALAAAGNVRAHLRGMDEVLVTLHEFAAKIGDFEAERAAIRRVVAADGGILDDASPRMSEIRRAIAATYKQIHDAVYGYLHDPEVARLLQNATVTLHGDRYVLPVKAENRGRLPGVVHRSSNTGATVFVEPIQCVELNNQIADLYEDERREVERLLNQLAVRVSVRADEILATLRVVGQVDLVSAKAQYACQFEMTRPQVSERGPLALDEARHPLLIDQAWRQEQAGAGAEGLCRVVPINVRLGSDFDLVVITGSNTGGKTVTLKTVAVLATMAQCGMFVPARRGAVLPVFRNVFVDIGDEQSLQQSLSTFGAHIKRIRYVLRRADAQCLVLLDELGAGTDPDEGGAIGQAVLDELRQIGCLGMVTTHLSVLKAYAYLHDRVDNASVEFNTETLCPTYRLLIGTPGESHAITVARKLGLPRRITSAALRHLTTQNKQFRKAIQATTVARQSAEQARVDAQAAQLAAQTQQEVYEAKLADLHRLKEEFETWLASIPELRPGDEVHVPSLGRTGSLVRLELHRRIAIVSTGSLEVEVPLAELMPDFGQAAVREQIAALRKQILEQARRSEEAFAEAARVRDEYQRSCQHQKDRARRFDHWLSAIARLRVGQQVEIARKPGTGKLVKVDLPGLRATVALDGGEEVELPIQDLFPQTGPFARPAGERTGRARRGKERARPREREQPRPMRRRPAQGQAAERARRELLSAEPGRHVFVVPFNKRATLIRVNAEKDQAVVQSGIFEMEIPLCDLELIREHDG